MAHQSSPSMLSSVFKVILLGDRQVGKTALLFRFLKGSFGESYTATMGLDHHLKTITLADNKKVFLELWDIGGEARFKALRTRLYAGTHGAILVYDVTRPVTLKHLSSYLLQLQDHVGFLVPFVVAGNKQDVVELSQDVVALSQDWIHTHKPVKHFYTSAKTGHQVNELFITLIQALL